MNEAYILFETQNNKDGRSYNATGAFIYENKKTAMKSAKRMAKYYAETLHCKTDIVKNGDGYKLVCITPNHDNDVDNIEYNVERHAVIKGEY